MHRRLEGRPLPALRRRRAHVVDARAGVDQVVVRGNGKEQRLLDEGADEIVAVAVFIEVPDRLNDAVKLAGGLASALQPRQKDERNLDDLLYANGWTEGKPGASASSFGEFGAAAPIDPNCIGAETEGGVESGVGGRRAACGPRRSSRAHARI